MTSYVITNKDNETIAKVEGSDYAEALGKAARLVVVRDALASGGYSMVSVNDPGEPESDALFTTPAPPKASAQTQITVRQIDPPGDEGQGEAETVAAGEPEKSTAEAEKPATAEPVKFTKNQPVTLPDGRSGKVSITRGANVFVIPDGEDSPVKLLKTELADARS